MSTLQDSYKKNNFVCVRWERLLASLLLEQRKLSQNFVLFTSQWANLITKSVIFENLLFLSLSDKYYSQWLSKTFKQICLTDQTSMERLPHLWSETFQNRWANLLTKSRTSSILIFLMSSGWPTFLTSHEFTAAPSPAAIFSSKRYHEHCPNYRNKKTYPFYWLPH